MQELGFNLSLEHGKQAPAEPFACCDWLQTPLLSFIHLSPFSQQRSPCLYPTVQGARFDPKGRLQPAVTLDPEQPSLELGAPLCVQPTLQGIDLQGTPVSYTGVVLSQSLVLWG